MQCCSGTLGRDITAVNQSINQCHSLATSTGTEKEKQHFHSLAKNMDCSHAYTQSLSDEHIMMSMSITHTQTKTVP